MVSRQYVLGLDFGSLSVRAMLVNPQDGSEAGSCVHAYQHGIITAQMPNGCKLQHGEVLQIPADYWESMGTCVRELMHTTGIARDAVVGIGLSATASTVLPTDCNAVPLCEYPQWSDNPHAYMKMWKHRGAADIAQNMIQLASDRGEPWLAEKGGIITCEWFAPKLMEVALKQPVLYHSAAHFVEVGDWLVWRLTGTLSRSLALARCNALLCENGYPPTDYFKRVCTEAEFVTEEKLSGSFAALGSVAGQLIPLAATHLGLLAGIPVSPSIVDAHATVLASGAQRAGDLTMIIGTSAVSVLLTQQKQMIPGVHIAAQDVSLPGLFSLGCGQSAVGDMLDWFMKTIGTHEIPYQQDEDELAVHDSHEIMMKRAALLKPGESGLLALDWWNGVRTPDFCFDLSGGLLGLTLSTPPAAIYRALLEAAAFGARRGMLLFEKNGQIINRIFAGGGIPAKNPLMMQIYADVLQRSISVCDSKQTGALGSAMLGAMAAGFRVEDVLQNMQSKHAKTYQPNQSNESIYTAIFTQYLQLCHLMLAANSPMQEMRKLQNAVLISNSQV